MSAIFQKPPAGTVVNPVPGGIAGRPPGGFVYPYWLPQIPGTITPKPVVQEPAHECPEGPITSAYSSNYYGSGYDDSFSNKLISGKSMRDCEIRYSHLENCTVTDCLLISCTVNNGTLTDVELRGCKVFKATVRDAKANGDCRFGASEIADADSSKSNFHNCSVSNSKCTDSKAWGTRFKDTKVVKIDVYGGQCTFTDCDGDIPKCENTEPVSKLVARVDFEVPFATDCPTVPFTKPSHLSVFTSGKQSDEVIKNQAIIGKDFVDCEIRDCFIDNATLTDCLLVDCWGNGGELKDVELRGCKLYKANVNDCKALDKCRFGDCTIHEGDLQNSFYNSCVVTSSELTNGVAWNTKFRDATINNIKFVGKCTFALCCGDIPKKESDSDSEEEMGVMPSAYNPQGGGPTAANPTASAAPPAAADSGSGAYPPQYSSREAEAAPPSGGLYPPMHASATDDKGPSPSQYQYQYQPQPVAASSAPQGAYQQPVYQQPNYFQQQPTYQQQSVYQQQQQQSQQHVYQPMPTAAPNVRGGGYVMPSYGGGPPADDI